MPQYKLTYLNVRGKGEVARYMLAYGDVVYEDIRIPRGSQQWEEYKKTLPFGQVPMLEVDGVRIVQSGAIYRLIAKRVGLYGNNDIECAQIDMIVDTVDEIWVKMQNVYLQDDPVKKAEAQRVITEEKMPFYLDKFERLLEKPGSFFVGNRMTLADIRVAHDILWPNFCGCKVTLDNHPKLKALEKAVTSHPKIAAWIAKRPASEF